MEYVATTGVIIYWKPYQTFIIHRNHYFWFDEYNSYLSIEDKQTPGSLLLCKILKVIFIIQTSSTWFHVNLILYTLHLVIQQPSHIKLSYLPIERKLVLIYWIMKTLKSHTSLIHPQINRLVINFHHKLR